MEKIIHKGKMIEVVQKKIERNGESWTLEFARRSPGVRLIIPKGDKILLSKEFRHELEGYDYRLAGGKVFDSLDEYNKALEVNIDITEAGKIAAIKEAKEEVGIEVKDISFLHKSICGATMVWDLLYFVVNDFTQASQELGEGEDIVIEAIDKERVKKMCLDGSISEERSALILMRYLNDGI